MQIKIMIDAEMRLKNLSDMGVRSVLTKILQRLVDEGKVTRGDILNMIDSTRP